MLLAICDLKTSVSVVIYTLTLLCVIHPLATQSLAKQSLFNPIFARNGTTLRAYDGCNGLLNGTFGVITSKNYPRSYEPNSTCKARVVVPTGYHILFKFEDFALDFYEGTIGCEFGDYIQFRDLGTGYKSRKYCSFQFIGFSWYTASNQAEITFISNSFQQARGYKISYKAVKRVRGEFYDGCNGFLRRSKGHLTSPNYPYNYFDGEYCKVTIYTLPGKRLKFTLVDFSLEKDSHFCERDSLEFEDGDTGRSSEKFCGNRGKGRVWLSDSNRVNIYFITNNGLTKRGYNMTYVAVDKNEQEYYDGCNGLIKGDSGSLKSQNYPYQYYSRLSCNVVVMVPVGMHILFTFEDFTLEETDSLCRSFGPYKSDYVQFEDVITKRRTRKFCGTKPRGTSWFSGSHKVKLAFKTNENRQYSGFHITFKAIKRKRDEFYDGCNGLLKADKGILQSPNHPNIYPNDLLCQVNIMTDPGKRIQVVFDEFDVGYELDNDFVQIKDQLTKRVSPRYKQTQGQYRIWRSDSHIVNLVLRSDSHYGSRGFKATYKAISMNETEYYDGCNGYLTLPRGFLTSPNYPMPYFNSDFCVVTVVVQDGYKIQLILQDFEVSEDVNCKDYVQFIDVVTNHTTRKLCSDRPMGASLLSQSNKIRMVFVTDYQHRGNGFKIRYMAVKRKPEEFYDGCNGVWKSSQGIVTSPNYPNSYQSYHNCSLQIIGPPTQRLRLRFEDFLLLDYEQSSCEDNVTITDVVTGRALPYLCGARGKGRMFISDSNRVVVRFKTGRTLGKPGFALSFKALDMAKDEFYDGCNGLMRSLKGHVKSPNYPKRYYMFDKCKVDIIVPTNLSIRVSIDDFQIVRDFKCQSAHLEIRDMVTNRTTGKLCGTLRRRVWFSDSHHIQVVFETGAQTPERGFFLYYSSFAPSEEDRHDGCNGVMTKLSQNVTSPGFPKTYESNEDCNTTIHLNSTYRVRIVIDKCILGHSRSSCRRDYLKITDLVSGRTTGRICGEEGKGLMWTSDSHIVSVYFHSDSVSNHDGFSLRYRGIEHKDLEFRSGCNGFLLTDAGVLSSPNYPKPYPVKQKCHVHIETDKNKRLAFLFNDFDLETRYPACYFDYVQFIDLSTRRQSHKLCDSQPKGVTWISDSNVVMFKFLSDRLRTSRGYNISYISVNKTYEFPDPKYAEVKSNTTVINRTWTRPICNSGFVHFRNCLGPSSGRERRDAVEIWRKYYNILVKAFTTRTKR